MTSIEAKREQFRKYLERCGLIDSLSKAFIRLYEEPNKPDDAIKYVRQLMCEECPTEEQFEMLKHQLFETLRKMEELEEELENFRGNLKRTDTEIYNLLEEGWCRLQEDERCKKPSLLKNYLTRQILDDLLKKKTPNGASLLDCVQSGYAQHCSQVGLYAADMESLDVYKSLFDPIIRDYHGHLENPSENLQPDLEWGDVSTIQNLDPEGKFVTSVRIRLARNLEGYTFFPIMKEKDFWEVENKIRSVAEGFEGEFKGNYVRMKDIDLPCRQEMVLRHVLFQKGDKFLTPAGCYRFWCKGRGLFYTPTENFLLWVNEEDHLRIMTLNKCGDLGDAYCRLVEAMNLLASKLRFYRHDRYGFVTTCPTNLGTTMRASVHIKLPYLVKDPDKFHCLLTEYKLVVRGGGGEGTEVKDGLMDISNIRRLGCTEYDTVAAFQEGILKLIEVEEELFAADN